MAETSTKPYLIRAIHEWCTDNGFTPYVAVAVDERTRVPMEFVRNNEIVLNVSPLATNRLHLGNDLIEFQARFGGVPRELSIPVENVTAIYARENGHGMAFEVAKLPPVEAAAIDSVSGDGPRAVESDSLDEGSADAAASASIAPEHASDRSPDSAPVPKPPQLVSVSATKNSVSKKSRAAVRDAAKPSPEDVDASQGSGADRSPVESASSDPAKTTPDATSEAPGDPEQPDPAPTKPRQARPKLTRIK